ncbi:response regulator transcription factor [Vibrio sp. S11_S32]|uniref:helix-turn-helix transcriptional regulator n=1 Tax=Vibrio sp. S11_S32 TaxID=2720225 RepID=UPI001681B589|nr:LuxR C-terminal-related transcriptional regulator [Vibrio sp. S11_S32]MBD1577202.1 response regulator transcription factor [Vibrio sp. S11_S32]
MLEKFSCNHIVLVSKNESLFPILNEVFQRLSPRPDEFYYEKNFNFLDKKQYHNKLVIIDFNTIQIPTNFSPTGTRQSYKCLAINTKLTFDLARRFLTLGYVGVIDQPMLMEQLPKAVRSILNGEYWYSRIVLCSVIKPENHKEMDLDDVLNKLSQEYDLTLKETNTCKFMLEGLTNSQIAEENHVSINTIKTHSLNVFNKLQIHSRKELINFVTDKFENNISPENHPLNQVKSPV